MTVTDCEIIGCLYGSYFLDCLHWVKPERPVFVRSLSGSWRQRRHDKLSFSLLGWIPVLANPFLTTPSLIICGIDEPLTHSQSADILEQCSASKDHLTTHIDDADLATSTAILGFLLLLAAPGIVASGYLAVLWCPLVCAILLLHAAVLIDWYRLGQFWRKSDRTSFRIAFSSLCVNPLGAVRSLDLLFIRRFAHLSVADIEKLLCADELDSNKRKTHD
jgi:hypothetical protein